MLGNETRSYDELYLIISSEKEDLIADKQMPYCLPNFWRQVVEQY
jgi:hypothetical protein